MAINLSRNTRLWVSTVNTGHTNSNTFEIPVQEGYSLSQSVATTDVSIEEAGPTPTRGGKRFNTNLDPVEWSFATYFNPYVDTDTNIYAVDMLMWHALATSDAVGIDFDGSLATTSATLGDATSFSVDFNNNSAHVLTTLYLYFEIDNDVYLVDAAQVGQAEVSIDIADIAMTSWSGNALSYTRLLSAPAFVSGSGLSYSAALGTPNEFVAIPLNKKYLVNKLTTVEFTCDITGADLYYKVPVTSGSITINNNVTYLTPNTLSQVDSPIGSFTGAFEVSGSMDAYMRDNPGKDGITRPNAKGTTELLEDMLANTDKTTNISNATFHIGGETSGKPQINIDMPTLHISVPSMSVDDVVSTSIEFKAIPASSDLISGTELTIDMLVAAP